MEAVGMVSLRSILILAKTRAAASLVVALRDGLEDMVPEAAGPGNAKLFRSSKLRIELREGKVIPLGPHRLVQAWCRAQNQTKEVTKRATPTGFESDFSSTPALEND